MKDVLIGLLCIVVALELAWVGYMSKILGEVCEWISKQKNP